MIRLGVCTEPKNIDLIAALGFDYIEVSLSWLSGLSDDEYQKQLQIVRGAPIGAEAANGMLPGDLRLTGPDVDELKIRAYLDRAFARAREMGLKVIVFGSGAARRVPDGWPQVEAWRQIDRYLTIAAEYARLYDLTVAIEPLRRAECNILNLVTEGTILSALKRDDRIGVLGDTYHMICSHEPYEALVQAGRALQHIHVSHTLGVDMGRVWPAPDDGEDYAALFEALKAAGYDGRVSIEAGCQDMEADGKRAFEALDRARRA